MFICLFNKLVDDLSVGVDERNNYAVDVAFPNERPYLAFAFQF